MTGNVTDTAIILNNGVSIPQLGLGVFQTPDGEATTQAVTWALQTGYRHIDTAMIYGNEQSVGEGLRRSGVDRRDVFLTTKLWNDDVRAGRAKEAFKESLDRLGVDYLDLYLIHWPAKGWQQAWERIEQNAQVFDFELSDEEMKAITAMNRDERTGADPDNFDF